MEPRFPINCDELKKGSVISRATLEDCTHKQYGTIDFNLKVLQVVSWVDMQLKHRDIYATLRMEKGALYILNDREASTYGDNKIKRHLKRMKKGFFRLAAVDVSGFNEDEKNAHDQRLLRNGLMIAGADLGMKGKLKLTPYKCDIPKLKPPGPDVPRHDTT